jgi:iron(III) transport system substrate-binding protein
VPPGYPAQYAAIIAVAEQEGRLVIHSTTDIAVAAPLIDDFQTMYPRIEVQYQDMNSNDLYSGYLADLLASPITADVLWSSAMDLQRGWRAPDTRWRRLARNRRASGVGR